MNSGSEGWTGIGAVAGFAADAWALLAAGVPYVVAVFEVQGWRWDRVREVRELVFALDADTARVAIMLADGHLLPTDAERLAWEGLQGFPQSSMASHAGHDGTNA